MSAVKKREEGGEGSTPPPDDNIIYILHFHATRHHVLTNTRSLIYIYSCSFKNKLQKNPLLNLLLHILSNLAI